MGDLVARPLGERAQLRQQQTVLERLHALLLVEPHGRGLDVDVERGARELEQFALERRRRLRRLVLAQHAVAAAQREVRARGVDVHAGAVRQQQQAGRRAAAAPRARFVAIHHRHTNALTLRRVRAQAPSFFSIDGIEVPSAHAHAHGRMDKAVLVSAKVWKQAALLLEPGARDYWWADVVFVRTLDQEYVVKVRGERLGGGAGQSSAPPGLVVRIPRGPSFREADKVRYEPFALGTLSEMFVVALLAPAVAAAHERGVAPPASSPKHAELLARALRELDAALEYDTTRGVLRGGRLRGEVYRQAAAAAAEGDDWLEQALRPYERELRARFFAPPPKDPSGARRALQPGARLVNLADLLANAGDGAVDRALALQRMAQVQPTDARAVYYQRLSVQAFEVDDGSGVVRVLDDTDWLQSDGSVVGRVVDTARIMLPHFQVLHGAPGTAVVPGAQTPAARRLPIAAERATAVPLERIRQFVHEPRMRGGATTYPRAAQVAPELVLACARHYHYELAKLLFEKGAFARARPPATYTHATELLAAAAAAGVEDPAEPGDALRAELARRAGGSAEEAAFDAFTHGELFAVALAISVVRGESAFVLNGRFDSKGRLIGGGTLGNLWALLDVDEVRVLKQMRDALGQGVVLFR